MTNQQQAQRGLEASQVLDNPAYRAAMDALRAEVVEAWKKVFCETNGVLYESITSAAKTLNIDKSSISAVCRKEHSHTKGYVFKYVEH